MGMKKKKKKKRKKKVKRRWSFRFFYWMERQREASRLLSMLETSRDRRLALDDGERECRARATSLFFSLLALFFQGRPIERRPDKATENERCETHFFPRIFHQSRPPPRMRSLPRCRLRASPSSSPSTHSNPRALEQSVQSSSRPRKGRTTSNRFLSSQPSYRSAIVDNPDNLDLLSYSSSSPPPLAMPVKREPSPVVLDTWRSAKAVCFDVDSTLCTDESIDEIAAFLGVGEEVAALTSQLSLFLCFCVFIFPPFLFSPSRALALRSIVPFFSDEEEEHRKKT